MPGNAVLNPVFEIHAKLQSVPLICAKMQPATPIIKAVLNKNASLVYYTGEYEVVPRAFEEIVLATSDKVMSDDVVVKEIPFSKTSNLSGGYTAIIGG